MPSNYPTNLNLIIQKFDYAVVFADWYRVDVTGGHICQHIKQTGHIKLDYAPMTIYDDTPFRPQVLGPGFFDRITWIKELWRKNQYGKWERIYQDDRYSDDVPYWHC